MLNEYLYIEGGIDESLSNDSVTRLDQHHRSRADAQQHSCDAGETPVLSSYSSLSDFPGPLNDPELHNLLPTPPPCSGIQSRVPCSMNE